MTTPQLFHCLTYADANRAIEFLTALGFTERLLVRDESDPRRVVHAQFQWRDNGGIMFGSVRQDDLAQHFRPGNGVCNLVVESDEAVDQVLQRAVDAGGTMVGEIHEPPHGGRSGAVTDPEGNVWNIDSYPGV